MSAPHPDPGSHERVRQEEDRISSRTIVLVGVGSLVIFFLAGLSAVGFLHAREVEHGPVAIPLEAGQSKIGIVEQGLFDLAVRGQVEREKQRAVLNSYGWLDERAGIVHIPIDRAMELVAQGARPSPLGPSPSRQEAQP